MAQAAAAVAPQMTPQELANTCYGLSLRGISCSDFLDGVVSVVAKSSSAWTAVEKRMDLPVIAWAFAKLGIVSKDMMQAVAVALAGSVPGLKEWGLCVVVLDLSGQVVLHFCTLGAAPAG